MWNKDGRRVVLMGVGRAPAQGAWRALALAAVSVAVVGGCAWSSLLGAGPARIEDGVLVTSDGWALYTFDRDTSAGTRAGIGSACVGECAVRWPPFAAGADAPPSGDFTAFVREDGTRQWAYKGRPLYRWTGDAAPGDRTGDGVDNLWRAARP